MISMKLYRLKKVGKMAFTVISLCVVILIQRFYIVSLQHLIARLRNNLVAVVFDKDRGERNGNERNKEFWK